MKVAILVAALTAVAHAGVVVQQGPAALIESGSSRVARTEDSLGNYAFGYDEVHTTGGSFRREQASPDGQVTGSYGLRDADGRLRTVNYIADAAGFRAAITSNEPGVESKNTAGVLINQGEVPPGPVVDETVLVAGPGRLVAAPAQLVAAPAIAAAAPAPIVAAAPAPAQLLAPSAPAQLLAAPQQLVAAAPAPIQFASQIAHTGLAAQATAPLNHGPLLGAAGISAPVLAAPGLDIFGRLSNAAVPTVNSNPLTDGPFARFNRPAISTPAALATGPLAAPLNPWQTTPLASPQVAASGQLLSAPVAPGPLAPGLAVARQQLIAQQPLLAPQLVAQQPLLQQQILAAPQPLLRQQLLAPQQQILLQQQRLAAPVAVAAAPAAIAGITYQTQINHALAPAAALAAPIAQAQVAY